MGCGKVLVLGRNNRSTLACIRSLGRVGLEVHLAWCGERAIPAASRYVAVWHDLPLPAIEPEAWKLALKAHLLQHDYKMVLPMSDHEVIPLQMERQMWCDVAPFVLLPDHAFAATYDKLQTHALVEQLGIALPRSQQVENWEELHALAATWQFPLVLKPASSFVLDAVSHGGRHVVRVFEPDRLAAVAQPMLAESPLLVQENFIGVGTGVELLAKEGRVLAMFQHRRLHEAPHGSGSSYRQSVPLNSELAAAATHIVEALRYGGVMMVEFKVNLTTGEWIFIEINGRFWGSLPLAVAAGADFPAWLYQMRVEGRTDFPSTYRLPLYARNTWSDVAWFVRNWRADRTDPRLNTRPIGEVAQEVTHIFRGVEVNDTLTRDDPLPAWREVQEVAGRGGEWLLRKLVKHTLPLPWVHRRYHRRLMQAWPQAERVLVVCKGNICRSPFAEALLRQLVTKHTLSAGYFPQAGRSTPAQAQVMAAAQGVVLATHRSRCLRASLLAEQDIVLVFDAANYAHVWWHYPRVRSRLFMLGQLQAEQLVWVEDPFGQGEVAFAACYEAITRLISPLKKSAGSDSMRMSL